MVQQAKYYSEGVNFTKTNALEMMEESKQVLQMTMHLSPNLLWKQVPGEMSPWLTVQCNGDLPKNKKNVTCCWLSYSAPGFNSSTKERISEKDTSTCTSWQSQDESGPQLPSPPDSRYLSPLECKGLEGRNCPPSCSPTYSQDRNNPAYSSFSTCWMTDEFSGGLWWYSLWEQKNKEGKKSIELLGCLSQGNKKGCPPWGMKAFNQIRIH